MLVPLFMFLYLVLNFFIAADIYLWVKSFRDPFRWKKAKVIFTAVYILLTSLIFAAYLLPEGTAAKLVVSRASNYYQGFLVNLSLTLIFAHMTAFILKLVKAVRHGYFNEGKAKFISGWVCAAVSIAFSLYGFINANSIEVKNYDVSVNKHGEDMRIVLAADLHLGYSLGVRNMEEMVEKINAQDADLVCFAGDIFDNDYEAVDDPGRIEELFRSIKSRYGVYACWGNHDIADKLFGGFTVSSDGVKAHDDRMTKMLSDSGIKLLDDEVEEVGGRFTIIGRSDRQNPVKVNGRRAVSDFSFDRSKLVIDMDHQPAELSETAAAGVDIDLSGHTHNGQFFPLTIPIKFIWENPAGHITKKASDGHIMHSIVTEGVGVYGPFMRTFTDSEIAVIDVHMNG